ncbi:MAG: hypothetical protein J6K74_06770 [Marinifilaceae bacterium]|nr:hypothetical protein [Marinifilaceae bacterium]
MHIEIKEAWKNCIRLYINPGKLTICPSIEVGAARRMLNRVLLPILAIAAVPSFFILTIDQPLTIAVYKTIINAVSIYVGACGVYGIGCYYVTDSPNGKPRETYLAPLVLNCFTIYAIPISLFYANEMHAWRYIAGILGVYYLIRTTIAGVQNCSDLEEAIKRNTTILISVTTITFPFLIQRILNLFFNLPIS